MLSPLTSSCDRNMIYFTVAVGLSPEDNSRLIPSFEKADYENICLDLSSLDWSSLTTSRKDDIQQLYNSILEELLRTIDCYISCYKKRFNLKMPFHSKKLLKRKSQIYKQSKTDDSAKKLYKQVSKEYDKAIIQWYDHVESKICDKRNSKSFYAFTNRKFKSRSFIPPLKTESGNLAISDIDKADVLNSVFHSVFISDDGNDLHLNYLSSIVTMSNIEITAEDIVFALAKLPSKVSRTPDGIPSYFLKRVVPCLINVLCYLFNLGIKNVVLHYQWKQANCYSYS